MGYDMYFQIKTHVFICMDYIIFYCTYLEQANWCIIFFSAIFKDNWLILHLSCIPYIIYASISWPKSRILSPNLNNNWMTAVIGRSRHVTGWTALRLVGSRTRDLDQKYVFKMPRRNGNIPINYIKNLSHILILLITSLKIT